MEGGSFSAHDFSSFHTGFPLGDNTSMTFTHNADAAGEVDQPHYWIRKEERDPQIICGRRVWRIPCPSVLFPSGRELPISFKCLPSSLFHSSTAGGKEIECQERWDDMDSPASRLKLLVLIQLMGECLHFANTIPTQLGPPSLLPSS